MSVLAQSRSGRPTSEWPHNRWQVIAVPRLLAEGCSVFIASLAHREPSLAGSYTDREVVSTEQQQLHIPLRREQ